MEKKIIIAICVVSLIILLSILLFVREKKMANVITKGAEENVTFLKSEIYDSDGNLIAGPSDLKEVRETIKGTSIQGVVTLKNNEYIYTFNGQHFGEYGVEMKEYTRAVIENKNQKCIDYYTSKEYDTTYIQEGDVIICTGDLIKYNMGDNDFDTKDNSIIVLKSEDYDLLKKNIINNENKTVITIEDYYDTTGDVYLKYELSDKEHKLPFALKFNIKDNVEIIGNIESGRKIKVQYKDLNVPLDEIQLKLIEVLEDDTM